MGSQNYKTQMSVLERGNSDLMLKSETVLRQSKNDERRTLSPVEELRATIFAY
jgi:hypothetical protein